MQTVEFVSGLHNYLKLSQIGLSQIVLTPLGKAM